MYVAGGTMHSLGISRFSSTEQLDKGHKLSQSLSDRSKNTANKTAAMREEPVQAEVKSFFESHLAEFFITKI
jgi:hypothetical protein